jgi:hypothetical protein
LDIASYQNEVFREKGFTIVKDFISKDSALFIQELLTSNEHCFAKASEKGNHRLFLYPNSPYTYPTILMQLFRYISIIKNAVYSSEPFYREYCETVGENNYDFFNVLNYQSKHTWSCFYWYKDGESHYKHIDHYGEFAVFLILSQMHDDYDQGGLYFEKDGESVYLDPFYEYGDLVFFDQEKYDHEVKSVRTRREGQIGRLQYYVPTIPYGYMKPYLRFEDHPFAIKFAMDLTPFGKVVNYAKGIFETKRHYSRRNYFKHFSV